MKKYEEWMNENTAFNPTAHIQRVVQMVLNSVSSFNPVKQKQFLGWIVQQLIQNGGLNQQQFNNTVRNVRKSEFGNVAQPETQPTPAQ